MKSQDDLFAPNIAQRFERWKRTPGGAQLMERLYRITSGYAKRWQRTGRKVSQRLLWELLRDRLSEIRADFARRGIAVKPTDGYLLNDHFTAPATRHMIGHHPEWRGLFELREGGARKKRKIIIIEEAA